MCTVHTQSGGEFHIQMRIARAFQCRSDSRPSRSLRFSARASNVNRKGNKIDKMVHLDIHPLGPKIKP